MSAKQANDSSCRPLELWEGFPKKSRATNKDERELAAIRLVDASYVIVLTSSTFPSGLQISGAPLLTCL